MTSDDYGFPVKLGQDVSRHHGRWMWRIEVREPDTMVAAWFTHDKWCAEARETLGRGKPPGFAL